MMRIPLTQGKFAVVDDCFYEPLMAMASWSYHSSGYAHGMVNGKWAFMHRMVWNLAGRRLPRLLDHRDGNGLNNRLENLRPATHSQNSHNRGPCRHGRSGFRGVTYHHPTRKWQAQIMVRGVYTYLGLYPTAMEAARAVDETAARLLGEYAYQNLPTTAV